MLGAILGPGDIVVNEIDKSSYICGAYNLVDEKSNKTKYLSAAFSKSGGK